MQSISHDVLVIGAGLAGQRAAIEAKAWGCDVGIVSKVHPVRSHSVAAAGGINAAIGKGDDWKAHFKDTVYGSDFLGDQDAIEILCKDAPARVREMESWGVVFSRTEKGDIAQRPFGGQTTPRTCYAADRTGHMLLHTLYDQLMKSNPAIYPEHYALSLILEQNTCKGVIMYDIEHGKLIEARAKSVLLATGGYGQAFSTTTNAKINTGDGLSLAFNAGLPLQDMEMVQFHPSGMYGKGYLVSEASRGEGAYLLNAKLQRFMKNYAPAKMELASRDVVARAITTEMLEGRGAGTKKDHVWLDVRHLGKKKIMERIPEIFQTVQHQLGIDCTKELIPIVPTAHYSMGGIPTDTNARVVIDAHRTPIHGLFAAGEVACVSVHGANRLGGNSLLETLVFGRIAGQEMAKHAKALPRTFPSIDSIHLEQAQKRLMHLQNRTTGTRPALVREQLQSMMMRDCGIFRNAQGLENGLRAWKRIQAKASQLMLEDKSAYFNTDLVEALETQNLIAFSQTILASAAARKESRGSHMRTDYIKRDDKQWLKHTLARKGPAQVLLDYKPVVIKNYKPEARHY
ncbi:MAG: FAD-binding protein [Candidatus Iainarchaeum archaeon]|uniref:succinate dehydrogenase n=1 Tax=Candidatus Iainarchaeum sp. TaxID=3101447 RepID=A0A7T9DKC8_9ARCH|nr:MAG: FAD-binding protein [Candidatus Diapherotrites archaeon]